MQAWEELALEREKGLEEGENFIFKIRFKRSSRKGRLWNRLLKL